MRDIDKVKSVSDVQFSLQDNDVNIINIKPSFKDYKETNNENDLTRFQKVCFGLAGLPYQAYFCAIGVFTTVYLLNNAGLPPEKTTYILFISRIIDALTDPIYGLLVNKTKLTRFGKMKPWIAVAIPLCSIAYIMMWYAPTGFSQNQLFVWYTFWHSFQFTVITGIRIPHTAMTMYLSHSKQEREAITVYRMGFEMIGLLLALVIQGPFVSGDSNCIKLNETQFDFDNKTNQTNIDILSNWDQYKYTYIAIVMTVVFLAGSLPIVIFVNEKPELIKVVDKKEDKKKKISTFKELTRMFTFKPYLLIIGSTIMTTSSIQIIQSNLQLYFEYGYTAIK
ncbi:sodium-dependent lysophosphatidylcholine symporter 1-B-like, partial [Brachionus plicatilis]